VIDEDNELSDLVEKIPVGTAVIDLGEIERINSCGVRDWVNWLSKLEVNGTRSVLVECSPAIVAQINLVNNFTGNGVVKSFYVPYFCPECDEEKVLLVEAADMGPAPHEPPTCRCDECDLVMDFDDMPDSYFAFMSNQKKLADRESLAGVARELGGGGEASGGAKGKVRSRVSSPSIPPQAGSPSVPSLPSIQRTSTAVPGANAAAISAGTMKAPSRPPLANGQAQFRMSSSGPGSRPPQQSNGSRPPGQNGMQSAQNMQGMQGNAGASFGFAQAGSQMSNPSKSNGLVFALIAILVAAIGVLAYLVLTK
jgi:hypothetical protein